MDWIPDRRRLGELDHHGWWIECTSCRHRVIKSREEMRAIWGARARLCWIAEDVRCGLCKRVGARLYPERRASRVPASGTA